MQQFYSKGKLLLTAEYLVLDGAKALALPTKFGQSMEVSQVNEPVISWESLDEKNNVWYQDTFSYSDFNTNALNIENDISKRLIEILQAAKKLNPNFLNNNQGFSIKTSLEFPKNWGLGTSSTLINNIANWANVDAYKLLANTFGGSGYDIACAKHNQAITYRLTNSQDFNNPRIIEKVPFNPKFKSHLFFVYLNQKQNSRDGISRYKKQFVALKPEIAKINTITKNIITCDSLENFQQLIETHEQIISNIMKLKPIKQQLFADFNGSVKSLGAWGGDFVLVASKKNPTQYFINKGYETVLSYSDMLG